MRRGLFAVIIIIIAAIACSGCKRESEASSDGGSSGNTPPKSAPPLPADAEINRFLLKVLEEHQLPAHIDGNWVAIVGSPIKVNGDISPQDPNAKPDFTTVQLALRTLLADGHVVEQQVVGMGKDRATAIAHAGNKLLLGSFHAWLAAFVDPTEDHVERAQRTIGGRLRVVTFGDVVTKTMGGEGAPADDGKWKQQVLAALDATPLSPGLHWLDVYHGQVNGEHELEVQLDSVRSRALETQVANAPWPYNGVFTSVRLFLVIQDPDDPTRPTTRPATQPLPKAVP